MFQVGTLALEFKSSVTSFGHKYLKKKYVPNPTQPPQTLPVTEKGSSTCISHRASAHAETKLPI